jgi:hypothetical protein
MELPSSRLWCSEAICGLFRFSCSPSKCLKACFQALQAHFSPGLSGLNCWRQQIPHAHEVVSGGREGEYPSDFEDAPVPQLP